MNDNLQITFRGLPPSTAVEQLISRRFQRLARVAGPILRCHVVVEQPHRHHHKGCCFSVRLDVTTASDTVVVVRERPSDAPSRTVHSLVRDVFDTATRKLEDHAQRTRESFNWLGLAAVKA